MRRSLCRSLLLNILALVASLSWSLPATAAPPIKPENYALLVGVTTYKNAKMNEPEPLQFPEEDAKALKTVFDNAHYEVDMLLGAEATQEVVVGKIANLKNKGNAAGVVVIGFIGHGVEMQSVQYYCPYDTALRVQTDGSGNPIKDNDGKDVIEPDPKSLVNFADLFRQFKLSPAGGFVVLADCCRTRPNAARGRAAGFGNSFKQSDVPENTSVLFACKPGQKAFEDAAWQHGAFTKCLLTEIDDLSRAGSVDTAILIHRLKKSVPELVMSRTDGRDIQMPQLFSSDTIDLQLHPGLAERPTMLKAPFERETAAVSQAAWASHLGINVSEKNSLDMKLKLIPPGEFQMGSSAEEIKSWNDWFQQNDLKTHNISDEGPQHRVRITQPFFMATTHVTRGQFRQFVEATSYETDAEKDGKGGYGYNDDGKWEQKPEYTWRKTGFEQSDDHPVVNVSWNDAVAFCKWLSTKERKEYRLPTEAEWEYACRAGTITRYWIGDDQERLAEIANVADATAKAKFPTWKFTIRASDGFVFTSPVGSFRANPFGLYDMHGNALQWCADYYGKDYYDASHASDPKGPDSGTIRVLRGGSWYLRPYFTRSANRVGYAPDDRFNDTGFRVARTQ